MRPKHYRRRVPGKQSAYWLMFLEQFYHLEHLDILISQLKKKHQEGFKPTELAQLSVLHSYLDYLLKQYR